MPACYLYEEKEEEEDDDDKTNSNNNNNNNEKGNNKSCCVSGRLRCVKKAQFVEDTLRLFQTDVE